MAQFMVTATYTDSAFAGMAHNPHNREEAIAKDTFCTRHEFGESAHDTGRETLHGGVGTTEAAGSLMIVAGGSSSGR